MQSRYGRGATFATILLLGVGGGFFCRDAILRLGAADVSEPAAVNEPATEEDDAEVDAVVFLRFSIIPHSKLEMVTTPEWLEILNRDQICPLDWIEKFALQSSLREERRNVFKAGPPEVFLNGFARRVLFDGGPQPIDPFTLCVSRHGSILNLTIDEKSCTLEHQGGCLFRVASPNGPVILLVSDYL